MKRFVGCLVAAASLSLFADTCQYVWNKTTAEEETVTTWPSLPSNGTHYADVPFVLQYSGQNFLRLVAEEKNYASAYSKGVCSNEHAIVEITDCNARVSATDRHLKVDLDSGTYNWLTPFGMTWTSMPGLDLMRTDHSSFDRATLAVHGATTYWPTVRFAGSALVEDRFVLDGGTHTIGGELLIPYRYGNFYGKAGASTYRFDVTNKASVTLSGGATLGNNSASEMYGTTKDKDIYFTVTDGSTLTLNAKVSQNVAGRQHILIADSTVVNGDMIKFGPSSAAHAVNLTTDTLITNSTFNAAPAINSGEVRFVDTDFGSNNGMMYWGAFAGARTRVDLVNCTGNFNNTSKWHQWPQYDGSCDVNFSGGTFSAYYVNAGGDGYDNCTGTVTVAENANVSISMLRLGPRWGGLGTLNVQSGTVTIGDLDLGGGNNAATTVIGGIGVVNVSGGTLKATGMQLGRGAALDAANYATHPGTNLVRVTGGVFADTATKASAVNNFIVCQNASARPSRIALDGGETRVCKLYGGAGAQVNGGKSWAAFEADGGTIAPPFAATTLLYGFDEATLGERGLTVASSVDCTIAQNFTDKEGATGRLILTGSGTKTLSGTNSRESELVVAGGSVVLADGAAHHSDVIVTNGASVTLSASAAAVVKNLTLGDADSYGVVTLVKDRTIAVAGDLVVNRARFAFDGFTALDTTSTVFTVAGAVSDASLEKLNESVFVSGLPTGATAEFVLEKGTVNVIKVTVREPIEYGITVTEGNVTNSVDRAYMPADTVVGDVSADAYLTLSGKNAKGGLLKRGAGTLYVTNEANRFLGSVILNEGRLSVSSMLALGYDAEGTGIFHLSGGTLELADPGDPAVFPYTLVTDPDTANAPVVVKTDEPTVVKSLTCTSGALFKRGKAPLVFRADADVTWNGGACNWGSSKCYELTAPETGWPFDDAKGVLPGSDCQYDAFNVVEGDVVFTSPGEERVNYTFCKSFRVGVPTKVRSDGAPNPRLVIDHAAVTVGNNANRTVPTVGGFMNADNCAFESAGLVLTNSALLHAYHFVANRSGKGSAYATFPTVFDIDHSTFEAERAFNPCGATINLRQSAIYTPLVDSAGNSSIGAICVSGHSTFNLDASVLAQNAAGDPIYFHADYGAHTLNCTNGSRLCCQFYGWYNRSGTYQRNGYLNFDDGELYPGATNFTIDATTFGYDPAGANGGTRITAIGKGLVLAPPENCTYTFAKNLYGTGGLVKRGAGTLNISATNLLATGTIVLEAGTLAITDAAVTNALVLTDGTLKDTALSGVTIFSSYQAGVTTAAPTFDGVTFGGTTRIDFSGADLGKTPFVFAHVTGAAPDLSRWRAANRDRNGMRAVFSVVGSDIVVTPRAPTGLKVFLR